MMKLIIDIPKEFESDYNGDLFKDFFSRVLCDIQQNGTICGNYEKEIAEMFLKAFDESKKMDNNGWIPCSERLPEEAFGCLVTVMDCNPSTQTDFENILPYFVGYDGDSWNDADGEEIPFEVLAWKKLPAPYQPKGE